MFISLRLRTFRLSWTRNPTGLKMRTEPEKRFIYRILQQGSIRLKPDGTRMLSLEHRCTAVLIWPEGEPPSEKNTVLTDPCFTRRGFQDALKQLGEIEFSFDRIGRIFVTHPHSDHCLHLPSATSRQDFPYFQPGNDDDVMSGIFAFSCPGHSPKLKALVFRTAWEGNVWITGDAVLDEEWLRAWEFFWPNIYSTADIIKTWKSLGTIIRNADIIVPGHGSPIRVTAPLLEDLISNFSGAAHSEHCKDIEHALRERLEQLQAA